MGTYRLRRVLVCAAVAVAGLAVPRPAAAASNAGLIVDGTATFAPGLSATPATQTVQFAGQGVLTVVRHGRHSPIMVACSFSGASTGTEDTLRGAGSLYGGCGTTNGEAMGLSCAMTYQRVSGIMTVSGGCTLGMADGNQATAPVGEIVIQLGDSEPVSSAPARAVVDLVTTEGMQAAVGSGDTLHDTAYSKTRIYAFITLAGVFASGPNVEAAVIGCSVGAYGPKTVVHELTEGKATVSCGGSSPTGRSVQKHCNTMAFSLVGAALVMGGQCTITVGGVATHVNENHSYSLVLVPRGSITPGYSFTAAGSHQVVAP